MTPRCIMLCCALLFCTPSHRTPAPAGKGKLRVLRIGEPVKVRSSLQAFTLKAQEAKAVAADPGIAEARREQQALRKRLRNSRRKRGEYLDRWGGCARGLSCSAKCGIVSSGSVEMSATATRFSSASNTVLPSA